MIIFGRDFHQVLPVTPHGTRVETIIASFAKSYLWSKMKILKLTRNMRVRLDDGLSEFLFRVGNGVEPTISDDLILLLKEMVIQYENDEISDRKLIDTIFHFLTKIAKSKHYMIKRAILATKNEHVDELNAKMIKIFLGINTHIS